jgi:hypothetical protein
MNTLTHTQKNFSSSQYATDGDVEETRSDALARLEARKPLCTPELMDRIAKANLPEIAGNLGKKKFFFSWF